MAHVFLGILVVFIAFQLGAFAKKKGELGDRHSLSLNWPLYLYIFTVMFALFVIFAVIYYIISFQTSIYINGNTGESVTDYTFWEILYYSGVTLLSIGYGDFTPVGVVRFLSLFEGFLGIVVPSVIFIKEMSKNNP
ncbi:two pore domain potassium channel family protein [Salinicoccus sp. ID82-1]|uniref:Two pore domain potassium channel family protein n=1 Tax=Salinicoccus cyprini TaxID=2493691 RepID=A0A558AQZ8_9STAP|nr:MULTISPECIES: ion channel [Salinicoccus]MCG1010259.1 two pore domain potassium channel family protein [Salinicoccus sp. ID82-1]TVT26687.1 two pore domain potassium channel family protein [Salinicoccus cyprini]